MFIYCSVIRYKYYTFLGFIPIKNNEEGKNIHEEVFNNLIHVIKNCPHVNCFQDGLVVYSDKVLLCTRYVIPTITDSIIPENLCKNNRYVINFTSDDMTSKFEYFTKYMLYILYSTENMRTEWLQMLHEYWDEGDKPYSISSDSSPK